MQGFTIVRVASRGTTATMGDRPEGALRICAGVIAFQILGAGLVARVGVVKTAAARRAESTLKPSEDKIPDFFFLVRFCEHAEKEDGDRACRKCEEARVAHCFR